jgi:hypothetical protein
MIAGTKAESYYYRKIPLKKRNQVRDHLDMAANMGLLIQKMFP